MSRNVCITACDGQTGFAVCELLLTHPDLSSKIHSIVGLSLHPQSKNAKELTKMGAKIVAHHPGKERDMVNVLKETGCDTLCLIPPAHEAKFDIVSELVTASQKAGIPNCVMISSAAWEYAERDKQPRLKEFCDLEILMMQQKGNPSSKLAQSPCVIRPGFYAENLLLYAPQIKEEKILPLPIGENHSFAPVALGDVAQLVAYVLTGKGKNGLDDRHRGQLIVFTGPKLVNGPELAENASKALGVKIEFESISNAEAKKVLKTHAKDHNESEREYLLEYYSLVRDGKTNYISTAAYHDVTGQHPTEPDHFFKLYSTEFKKAKK